MHKEDHTRWRRKLQRLRWAYACVNCVNSWREWRQVWWSFLRGLQSECNHFTNQNTPDLSLKFWSLATAMQQAWRCDCDIPWQAGRYSGGQKEHSIKKWKMRGGVFAHVHYVFIYCPSNRWQSQRRQVRWICHSPQWRKQRICNTKCTLLREDNLHNWSVWHIPQPQCATNHRLSKYRRSRSL